MNPLKSLLSPEAYQVWKIMPICCDCGKEMRFNVPRLGPGGGYVHAHTGFLVCQKNDLADRELAKKREQVAEPKMTPEFIEHTINTFSACCVNGTIPSPNLQHAIAVMLTELKRVKSLPANP